MATGTGEAFLAAARSFFWVRCFAAATLAETLCGALVANSAGPHAGAVP